MIIFKINIIIKILHVITFKDLAIIIINGNNYNR